MPSHEPDCNQICAMREEAKRDADQAQQKSTEAVKQLEVYPVRAQ